MKKVKDVIVPILIILFIVQGNIGAVGVAKKTVSIKQTSNTKGVITS